MSVPSYRIDAAGRIRSCTDNAVVTNPVVLIDTKHKVVLYTGSRSNMPLTNVPDNCVLIEFDKHLCTEQCAYALRRLTESPNDDFTADLCCYNSSSEVILLVVARAMQKQPLKLYSDNPDTVNAPAIEPDNIILPDDMANAAADYTARERAILLQGYIAGLSKAQPSQTGDALRTISAAVVQLIPNNNT